MVCFVVCGCRTNIDFVPVNNCDSGLHGERMGKILQEWREEWREEWLVKIYGKAPKVDIMEGSRHGLTSRSLLAANCLHPT